MCKKELIEKACSHNILNTENSFTERLSNEQHQHYGGSRSQP
jgi:hypothetical protein